jgi:RNA polymerase sigma-70 factor (ECF subfamily)
MDDLELLYRRELPRLHAFARRMVGDDETAEDIVQECFALAAERGEAFRGESSEFTYLAAIVKNLCYARLRRSKESSFEDIEELVDRCSEPPSPERSESEIGLYALEVRDGCLLGLLKCLPRAQRCVFVLHLLKGVSIERAAAIMGRSVNATRVLLSRSRSSMRAFLCANCSLMRQGNKCSCANMIEFSLRRGLIRQLDDGARAETVLSELRCLGDELELYRSLPESEAAIARLVEEGRYPLLSKK